MRGSFLAAGIFGLVLILAGIVFALQGRGMIGGSAMTGNSFWIYAGSGIAVLGIIIAALGFYLGFKSRTAKRIARDEEEAAANRAAAQRGSSAPHSTA